MSGHTFLPEITWIHVAVPPGPRRKFEKAPAGAMCSCLFRLTLPAGVSSSGGQCLSSRSTCCTAVGAANSSCRTEQYAG